jgi:hypothetical protein
MSTTSDTRTNTAPMPTIGLSVSRLHWWDRNTNETELFYSYDAALHHLATILRQTWNDVSWRPGVPATSDGLTDAQVVVLFYDGDGGAGGRETPTCCVDDERGFEIVDTVIHGPAPAEVSLRLASLRVLDGDPDDPAVTYCLDADGLTIAVSHGPDGSPVVHITPQAELSGIPVTVRLQSPPGPVASRAYRVS